MCLKLGAILTVSFILFICEGYITVSVQNVYIFGQVIFQITWLILFKIMYHGSYIIIYMII